MSRIPVPLFLRSLTGKVAFLAFAAGWFTLLWVVGAWGGQNPQPRSKEGNDLVDIREINARIVVDLKYAAEKNFTGKKLYESNICFLRRSTAIKLDAVQRELEAMGLGLKVWDCYRPLSVQGVLWAVLPDERYVGDPKKAPGHSRAASVDLTLVDLKGNELEMPTGFDEFSPRAHRRYGSLSKAVIRNRAILETVMKKHGFNPLAGEWWHFDDEQWRRFDVLDLPFSSLPSVRP